MEELRSLMAFAVCLLGEHGYGKDGGLGEGFSLAFRHTIRCVHVDDERSAAWDFVGVVDGGSGIPKHLLVNRSTQSDIIGISQGHNLSSLLPIEYSYLSDPTMTALFMQRYIEKRLQVFEHQSEDMEVESVPLEA